MYFKEESEIEESGRKSLESRNGEEDFGGLGIEDAKKFAIKTSEIRFPLKIKNFFKDEKLISFFSS
jgi:hypothetical protein